MAGASVNMKVTGVAQFKQDINTANQQIKTMNADLALAAKQFKATGDKEDYLQKKTALLNAKLEQQEKVLKTAEEALNSMKKNGVTAASAAFQDMQRKVIAAKGSILDTKTQLETIEEGGEAAGKGVGSMNEELKKIGEGVSWDNVTKGIKDITNNLEKGARAAINMGKRILESAKGSTGWADELLTMSTKYGIDVETLQRMQNAAAFVETDVETILNAKDRLAKNSGNLGELLGIETAGMSVDDAFWKTGEAIMALTDEFQKEEIAQKIFGKSWKDLVPLFTMGQEEYNKKLAEQNVLTTDQVQKLGQADDAIQSFEQELERLKSAFWAENADKLTGVLQWIVDNSSSIVTAVEAIGAAFAAMKIGEFALNVTKVVKGFETMMGLGGAGAGTGGGAGTGVTAGVKAAITSGGGLSALTPLAVLGLGIAPALWANNRDRNNAAAKQASRVANANLLGGTAGWFLGQSANALGIQASGQWGDYGAIEALLMGLGDRSAIEKSQLHNLLNGSFTSQGNSTWNELMRLWGGEEMDMGRMTAILESVTEAYDKMAQQSEQSEKSSDNSADASDKMADAASKLPKEVAAAVRGAVSGMSVVLNGDGLAMAVGQILAAGVMNG